MTDLRIALYQPDIAGNTGTILRMAACLGLTVDIIEPAGFDLSERNLKRSGLDYLEKAAMQRHLDWSEFDEWRRGERRRLILFSTKASKSYTAISYQASDILLFGRESAGVAHHVHQAADQAVTIAMPGGGRSLNVALSAAMAVGEAMRQIAAE